jgi:hypothetical protein
MDIFGKVDQCKICRDAVSASALEFLRPIDGNSGLASRFFVEASAECADYAVNSDRHWSDFLRLPGVSVEVESVAGCPRAGSIFDCLVSPRAGAGTAVERKIIDRAPFGSMSRHVAI